MVLTVREDDPVVVEITRAIRTGDLAALERLLRDRPDLASARIISRAGGSKTTLHIVADWPGHFPNGAAVVNALVAAGAEIDAPVEGRFSETPLHWAASSDDLDVATALIAAGANIEAPGASIAGGTPLDDAVGYGCWHVARLLVDRGAKVDKLWHASALGMMARLEELLAADPAPTPKQLDEAFWQACHGGQRRAAEYLLGRGADINFVPGYARETPLGIAGSLGTQRDLLVSWLREQGARPSSVEPTTSAGRT